MKRLAELFGRPENSIEIDDKEDEQVEKDEEFFEREREYHTSKQLGR